jgi:hypothetical protein
MPGMFVEDFVSVAFDVNTRSRRFLFSCGSLMYLSESCKSYILWRKENLQKIEDLEHLADEIKKTKKQANTEELLIILVYCYYSSFPL